MSEAKTSEATPVAVVAPVIDLDESALHPCNCTGYCQKHIHPEYCVNWLARTYHMTLEKCHLRVQQGLPESQQYTVHRDAGTGPVCNDCYPLFPTDTKFITV